MRKTRKKSAAVKRSISMPAELWEKAQDRIREKHLNGLSAYAQELFRKDLLAEALAE